MSDEAISGSCPSCSKNTDFRELSLGECFVGVGKFVGNFFTKSLALKAKDIFDVATSAGFPNYVCLSCNGQVMQCKKCKEIIPYADVIEKCPHCGCS